MFVCVCLNKDTSLIRTPYVVPRVSIIERFHCTLKWEHLVNSDTLCGPKDLHNRD